MNVSGKKSTQLQTLGGKYTSIHFPWQGISPVNLINYYSIFFVKFYSTDFF